MQRTKFREKLSLLHEKYNSPIFDDVIKSRITIELQCLLQDYLWEGQGFKTFSTKKYRQLALTWHPDKLKHLKENAALSEENQFLLWYAKRVKSNDNAPFQAINTVQEKYRPELRFRQQDITDKCERFYFFGSFSNFFPYTYNIFWPFFYLLEALERNIDNYQNAAVREWAKRIYTILSCIPVGTLVILLVIISTQGGVGLLLDLCNLLGDSWLSLMTYSAITMGITMVLLCIFCDLYLIITKNPEFDLRKILHPTDNILFELPFQSLKEAYSNKNYSKATLLLGVLLTQILVCAIGFSYALPFLKMLFAFPLAGLILVNIPLLTKQCYDNPHAALNIIKEYGFTIYNRYQNLLTTLCHFAMQFWPKRQQTPPAHQAEQQFQQVLPVLEPYWHQKWKKYLAKNIDSDESRHENTIESLTILNLKVQNLLLTQAQKNKISSHEMEANYPYNLDHQSLKEKDKIEFSFSSLNPRMNRN